MLARPRSLAALTVVSVTALTACGISLVGSAPDDAGADAGSLSPPPANDGGVGTNDSGGSSSVDGNVIPPAPPCLGDACAPLQAPPPFALALYGDRAAACPSGFTNADVVKTPAAQAGACACGACAPSATCMTGTIGTKYSSDTKCDNPAGNIDANNGACFPYNGAFVSTYCSILPPPATPGPCSAPGVGVPAKLTADATTHLCHPAIDSCAETFCAPPNGMKTCLVAEGDVACPANAATKTLVGSEPDVTCGACTCTSTATCTGSLTFYSGSGCTGGTKVLQANTCTMVNQASIKSTQWAGTASNLACTNIVPGAPTSVGVKNARTVCCPP